MTDPLDRTPPYSEASERALLGCLLLEGGRVMPLCRKAGLEPDAFYLPAHKLVWRACAWLDGTGKGIDVLMAANALRTHGFLEGAGGQAALDGLIDSAAVSAHAEHYLADVQAKWLARRLVAEGLALQDAGYDGRVDPQDVLAGTIHRLTELAGKRAGQSRTKDEVWERVLASVQSAKAGRPVGLPAPWPTFTSYTGGARFGGVTLLIGRSKTRKSYVAHQWGLFAGVSREQQIPGAYYPLEDGQEIALMRAACCLAGVDCWRFETGKVEDSEMAAVNEAAARIRKSPYDIRFGRGMSLPQWRLEIARGVANEGWRFVTIDAFKDMQPTGGNVEQDARLSGWLHDVAGEFDLAMLVVQHVKKNRTLNRTQDRDERKTWWERIIKEDARGASQITDGARMIVALQCQLKRDKNGQNRYTHYVLDGIANNYGQTGSVCLDLDEASGVFTEAPGRTPFADWTEEEEERDPWYKRIGAKEGDPI